MKYLSIQVKQFLLSSALVVAGILGITISKSFNSEYLAQLEQNENVAKEVAEIEKENESNKDKKDDKSGVAMK